MPFKLFMPKLSPTMEGGTIIKWHKKESDFVKEGELLFEVATDKATVEYQALDAGFLRKILVTQGQEAMIGAPVAIFSTTQDESIQEMLAPVPRVAKEVAAPIETPVSVPAAAEPIKTVSQEIPFVQEPPLEDDEFEYRHDGGPDRVFASPLAKKIARERNIDLSLVKGSGPQKRIVSEDLKNLQGAQQPFHHRKAPEIAPGSYQLEPMTPMRKTIGKRLQAAKSFIPHFYSQIAVDAEPLIAARNQLKEVGYAVTFNDFILRATALVLKEHPVINSGYNNVENCIIRFKTVDIAMAVSIQGGLITPLIRHADHKNLMELSKEAKKLIAMAKENQLQPHQYKGGSFSISNLGMYGITNFTPIINPPQAAILGVGGILDEPMVKDGKVVPGKKMTLTLAADHRVIDGADAALFLNQLKKLLENPVRLLI